MKKLFFPSAAVHHVCDTYSAKSSEMLSAIQKQALYASVESSIAEEIQPVINLSSTLYVNSR